jgi:hypothetical protein
MEDSSQSLVPNKSEIFELKAYSRQRASNSAYVNRKKVDITGLNEGQKFMVEGIVQYLAGELNIPYFLVQGPGGTGKSFAIYRALKCINSNSVIGAATSHFAKNVLSDFLGKDFSVTTIASLLGKRVSFDDNGKEILINNNIRPEDLPIMKHSVIIIDEISMIDDETADEIINICNVYNKKLILLGDFCQVPPVRQKDDSKFFDIISAELTESMRFKGPILSLANAVRDEIVSLRNGGFADDRVVTIHTDRVSMLDEVSGSGYIFLNSINTVINAAVKRYKMGHGTGYVRILAYRNKTIDKLNTMVRTALYGENSLQFEHGESLIASSIYTVNKTAVITNGELLQVESAEDVIGPYEIPCKKLIFIDKVTQFPVYTVAREGYELYEKTYRKLESDGKKRVGGGWPAFYAFKESFAYFNYSYVTSIHKAQGSSIAHVFIIEEDIYTNRSTTLKEKLQLLYVAISRASFRAYIYNKNQRMDNGNLSTELLKLDK